MMPTIPPFDIFSGRFGEKGVLGLELLQGWMMLVLACLILRRSNSSRRRCREWMNKTGSYCSAWQRVWRGAEKSVGSFLNSLCCSTG